MVPQETRQLLSTVLVCQQDTGFGLLKPALSGDILRF